MDSLQIKAILAGMFFGAWPLLMNRSNLNASVSAVVFSIVVLVIVFPFSVSNWANLTNINWTMAVLAGIAGAIGLLLFNSMLSKATIETVGTLFVLSLVAQITVSSVYKVLMSGDISLAKGVGFALAALSAVLLTKA
ncbi:hypothetical protein ISR92_03310 [Patescibacteria group bacterium]|nr:hypothetical protein [Patescibacteria group bacterium]